ncbi:MAG: molecular chaperone HscC [Lachnospiraceae bacterium]|nr:molecular chaperone HscC [Lachnospiraceae bacterium]
MLIGIDLGTTNSLAACYRNGRPELIPNRFGKYLTPSVVAVDDFGVLLVGESAKEYSVLHPLQAAKVFKRSMGTDRVYHLGDKVFRSEELSAMVLRSLKEDAEKYLGCPVTEAVISVPAYFNEFQRKATQQAGEIAGLQVQRIINEPTAAALAYGLGDKDKDERCLVFDLGGGTFDVSILEFYKNIVEVHAVAGDNFLGGEDFTEILAKMFLEKNVIAPESLDQKNKNRVMKAAEICKCRFAETNSSLMTIQLNGELLKTEMDLAEYETACQPLLDRIRKVLERSIRDADLKLSEIDRIVLVGGATRLPIVRKFVIKLFGGFPSSIDPDTAVAQGAALQCGIKEREEEIREIVLTDVCPFTLGTEVNKSNGVFDESNHYLPIIQRNTVIPVSRTETLYTAHDNQSRILVKILQGESRLASNNLSLGEILVPVPPGPKGKESVEITYTYDVNSLLEVVVKVVSTGISRKTVIQGGNTKLSEQEVQERLEKLSYLKQNPRDEETNRLLLLRGERLYEECTGQDREIIDQAMMEFEQVLKGQDRKEIERAGKRLAKTFDEIEGR